jgi:undecaprenyl-diphosphatase
LSIIEAIILGAVQGITEFLPVSSSGHLVLLQEIFGIQEPTLLFDTMVHVGTLVAVCSVLWKDIWSLLKKIIQPLTLYLIIGTIPAVVAALLFRGSIEAAFSSTSFLGFAFLITTGLLVFSELFYKRKRNASGDASGDKADNKDNNEVAVSNEGQAEVHLTGKGPENMTWIDALIIGIFQAVAITPGISRSGATLSAAFIRGLSRDFAVRFSFLLSIPAILGALVLQIKDLGSEGSVGGIGAVPLAVGAIVAAVVGFFSIKLMLKIVREKSLLGFALYTGILGILVLIDRFGSHFFL